MLSRTETPVWAMTSEQRRRYEEEQGRRIDEEIRALEAEETRPLLGFDLFFWMLIVLQVSFFIWAVTKDV